MDKRWSDQVKQHWIDRMVQRNVCLGISTATTLLGAGLKIQGGSSALYATTNKVFYTIGGRVYSVAAAASQAISQATPVLANGQECAIVVFANVSGVLSTVAGPMSVTTTATAQLPVAADDTLCPIGILYVVATGAWTPSVTALDSNVTTSYLDLVGSNPFSPNLATLPG